VQIPRDGLRQGFRRGYADEAAAAAAAPKPPKRRFRFLRWTWRIIYLSALGGLAYTSYGVYQSKHPPAQQAPDPKKKTLVVLGKTTINNLTTPLNDILMHYRYWMGLSLTPQSPRHRKL
jgi:hypothetical protein